MYTRVYLSAMLIFWSAFAWSADANGFTITIPCGTPPFGDGTTDMHLHLVHFPKQRPKQELVLMMPSRLGPAFGVTDWVDAVGKLCSTGEGGDCSNAQNARVRVLSYSSHYFLGKVFNVHISGEFDVHFNDGTSNQGTFTAKERRQSSRALCE